MSSHAYNTRSRTAAASAEFADTANILLSLAADDAADENRREKIKNLYSPAYGYPKAKPCGCIKMKYRHYCDCNNDGCDCSVRCPDISNRQRCPCHEQDHIDARNAKIAARISRLANKLVF